MDDRNPGTETTSHRFRLTHAVFGLVFIAMGLFGLDGDSGQSSAWVWVALLTGAGIAGIMAVISSVLADRRDRP